MGGREGERVYKAQGIVWLGTACIKPHSPTDSPRDGGMDDLVLSGSDTAVRSVPIALPPPPSRTTHPLCHAWSTAENEGL